jgi:hypothetical protein
LLQAGFLSFLRINIRDGDWQSDEFCGVQVNIEEKVGEHQENLAGGEDELQELSEEQLAAAVRKSEDNLQKRLAAQGTGKQDVTVVELLNILRSRELNSITSKSLVDDIDCILEVLTRARGLVDLSSRQTVKIYSHFADRVLGF